MIRTEATITEGHFMIQVTDEYLAKFKELCAKEGITYDSEAEYRDAAYNLINLVDVLVDMSKEHLGWEKRLKEEPGGIPYLLNTHI